MARAYAGIITPLVVIIVLLIQGVATPGYDPIRQTISELGTGWGGTRIVGLYGFIVLTCVWESVANALGTRISVAAWISALLVVGIGCVGLALVNADSGAWNSMTWQGRLHLIFAFGFVFTGIPAVCLAASRALPAEWRGLRGLSLATGLACLVVFAGTLIALAGKRADPWVVGHLGLIERSYVIAFMIWQCIVSARLARLGHKDSR